MSNNGSVENNFENKPFGLVKYFTTISILVIVIASLTLALFISREVEITITERLEDDTVMLMNNLNYQMFNQFLVPMSLTAEGIQLRDKKQYELLNEVIFRTIHGFDIKRVVIYNNDGQVVYSTDPELLGKMVDSMLPYLQALRLNNYQYNINLLEKGKINIGQDKNNLYFSLWNPPGAGIKNDQDYLQSLKDSTVHVHEGESFWEGFFPKDDFTLRSFKVMENYQSPGQPSGVLEVSRNLSSEYKRMARLRVFAFVFAMVIAIALIIVLTAVVKKGEYLINQKNKEREDLAKRLNKTEHLAVLGSMVATVAHEIRNPLGIIHSSADFLSTQLENSPQNKRLSKIIEEEAERLSEIVTEFLDFARPMEPKLIPIIIEDIIEELFVMLELTTARAGVEIQTDFMEPPLAIPADSSMIRRALLNIFINSIQAMPDGGLVTVTTQLTCDEYLLISIKDTGPGLSEEAAKRFFTPFFTTKIKGTGLGMAIVKNIINAHGGKIEFENVEQKNNPSNDDTGLTILIYLPIHNKMYS